MCFLVIFLTLLLPYAFAESLIAELPNGKVQGIELPTPSGRTFYSWRRIPYAKPPVGQLRFLPPRRPDSWDGVLDGTQDSPACIIGGTFNGDPVPINGNSEDCLYINVYSPLPYDSELINHPNLTVLFWIYGGGFFSGCADFTFYDPTPFLEENVVVVSFNYRLSTFGFLSTEDDIILGNAALKDQLLALQWTRENIAYFGGNPLDITIIGESAGAFSVGYHIVSPMSRNLFKAAIMESGSSLVSDLFQIDAKKFAYNLASQIDSSITEESSSAEVRDVLQAADVDLVINLTIASNHTLGPVLEPSSHFAFLSAPIYEEIEQGNFAQVPIIIGNNEEETIDFISDLTQGKQLGDMYSENPQLLSPSKMHLKENVTAEEVGREIKNFYVGEDNSFGDNLAAFLNWKSDDVFVRSIYKQAILQSKYSPVYMYQFSYYGTLSKAHLIVPGAGRVGHFDEVGYMFNISTKIIETESDLLTRKRLVKLWTNFAKTLNPTPDDESTKLLQNVKWDQVTPDKVQYLDIGDNLSMKPSRKTQETLFWDHIWNTYSYRPYNIF